MVTRYPIEYTLEPRSVPEPGVYRFTVHLKNVGDQALSELDVRLNSLDTGCVRVLGENTLLRRLEPGQERVREFQVSALSTGDLYVSVKGEREGEPFSSETPGIPVQVGTQPAELLRFTVQDESRSEGARLGEPIHYQATVRGLTTSTDLVLEFWADMPSGESRSLAKAGVGRLEEGELYRHVVPITPKDKGLYVLHAYLYQGDWRIGHLAEYLSIAL